MTGKEYEDYCKKLLEEVGYQVIVTPRSGDQGLDLIAHCGDPNVSWGYQCKRYSNPVGNRAVQEAYAGQAFYGCQYVSVVSNAGFTQAAKDLASRTHIFLWSTEEFYSFLKEGEEDE